MGNITGERIRMIVLNSMRWPSNLMIDSFRPLINFTVYQSTHDNDMWSRIGGVQDDIFVYDRCGLLAYYVPFPHSYVSHGFVEAAIVSAYVDSPCRCLPTPSSASSNCTNGTEDNRNSSVGQVNGPRQVQTPVPSVQSQRQVRALHNRHRSSRLSTTPPPPPPPECSRASIRDLCSNNTTQHQRSLTPLQQRCCHQHHHHRTTHHRRPASTTKCLCLAVDGDGEQGCLCRPGDGSPGAGRSCFCRLLGSTVESGCSCEEPTGYSGNGPRQCTCTLPRDRVTRQCAWQESPTPYGRFGGGGGGGYGPGQSGALCTGHVQPLLWRQTSPWFPGQWCQRQWSWADGSWVSGNWQQVGWKWSDWQPSSWVSGNWQQVGWKWSDWQPSSWVSGNWQQVGWKWSDWQPSSWVSGNWQQVGWKSSDWQPSSWVSGNWRIPAN